MSMSKSTIPATSTVRSPHADPAAAAKIMVVAASGSSQIPSKPHAIQRQRIAEGAYYIAEKRHFIGGDAIQDWLKAEQNISQQAP